ncbi:HNH endonuclease [Gluconobacter kondonii]|uniref:HNH endonuclease n=1 Tax=Gluconobacter kondonii TaxID=941463 RepID=UPI001B8ACCA8|nr:HNH endonuclease [Gluconobacter kondonii]
MPLITRIDNYCSYCERKLECSLAVEHIQPKGLPAYAYLETTWSNFLLGCVNCNSTKGNQNVVLADVLLPDRDNTFLAYEYELDGSIEVSTSLAAPLQAPAAELLRLTGLDRKVTSIFDDNQIQIIVDRVSKRINVFGKALDMRGKLSKRPNDDDFIDTIVALAAAEGLFSIWMKVFVTYPEVCRRLINTYRGTRESGCFDPITQAPVSPHPNTDALTPGGRL